MYLKWYPKEYDESAGEHGRTHGAPGQRYHQGDLKEI